MQSDPRTATIAIAGTCMYCNLCNTVRVRVQSDPRTATIAIAEETINKC